MKNLEQAHEIWKCVPGFENYEVSNMGQVRAMFDSRNPKHSKSLGRWKKGRLLSAVLNRNGRLLVDMNGKKMQVHRLVMMAFVGLCPLGQEVNHRNGKATDNRLENLEYCTRSENHRHAYALGLRQPICLQGESHGRAKLTEIEVREIRAIEKPMSITEMAKRFHVSRRTIKQILLRQTWRHIS